MLAPHCPDTGVEGWVSENIPWLSGKGRIKLVLYWNLPNVKLLFTVSLWILNFGF